MNIRMLAPVLVSIAALVACSSDDGGGTGQGSGSGNGDGSGSSNGNGNGSSSSSSSYTCCVNKAFYKCSSSTDMQHCAARDMESYCPRDSSQDAKCKD